VSRRGQPKICHIRGLRESRTCLGNNERWGFASRKKSMSNPAPGLGDQGPIDVQAGICA